MTEPKKSAVSLISQFFGRKEGQTAGQFMIEMKELPDASRVQLASAIARQIGLAQDQCSFEFVPY